jgi:hypothetical protein
MNMSDKTEVDKIINHLEGIDGETMEYIVKELCMVEQLFKQTILTMSDVELNRMLDERKTTENSCGSDTPYHFISSHGELFIDKDGNVLPQSELSDWLLEIGKVDVEELIHYLQLNGFDGLVDGDVLDFGYWDKNGEYHKPYIGHRKDIFHNQNLRYTQIEEVITKNEQWLNKYRTV